MPVLVHNVRDPPKIERDIMGAKRAGPSLAHHCEFWGNPDTVARQRGRRQWPPHTSWPLNS
eukprot:scaffold26501_cov35-Tisochrysis_lutea.AAC.3